MAATTKTHQSQDVATQRPGAIAIPEHLRGKAGAGTEDFAAGTYEFPRILLLQGISPQLQTHDGLKAGDFFHTMTEQSIGSEFMMTPLYMSERYVLWAPLPPIDNGGILARADDGVHWNPPNAEFTVKVDRKGSTVKWRTADTVSQSGLAEWGTYDPSDPKSQPAATKVYVMIAALPELLDISPVAILFQRSSIKPAQGLRGKLRFSRAPMWGTRFRVSSKVEVPQPNQSFNNWVFSPAGFVEDPEEAAEYERLHESFKASGVQVRDLESAQGDEASAHADSAAADAARAAANEKGF